MYLDIAREKSWTYSRLSESHKREAIKVLGFIAEDETKLKQIAEADR
jgi:hypothetical protein